MAMVRITVSARVRAARQRRRDVDPADHARDDAGSGGPKRIASTQLCTTGQTVVDEDGLPLVLCGGFEGLFIYRIWP